MADWEESDSSSEEEPDTGDIDFNKDWFKTILSEYHKEPVEVSHFEISSNWTAIVGILCTIKGIKAKYTLASSDTPRDLSVIVKGLPKHSFTRYVLTRSEFDLREIKFYTEVLTDFKEFQARQLALTNDKSEEIPLSVPVCYHAHYRPAGGTDYSPIPPESVLVLDDLRSSGFTSVKLREGLTMDQTKVALEAIARIHAHSLAMKVIALDEQPLSERYPFLFQTVKATDSYHQVVDRSLLRLAEFLAKTPGFEAVLEALLVLRPRIEHLIPALLSPAGPLALITHTDFWCGNLLFRETPSSLECCIIDWQMVTYSQPTNDIALLLISSVPTELRRTQTETLLDTYWNALVSTCRRLGLDIPKDLGYMREHLTTDYKRSQLLALLLCIGSIDVGLEYPQTEQRLVDVLKDLYEDGVLVDPYGITLTKSKS